MRTRDGGQTTERRHREHSGFTEGNEGRNHESTRIHTNKGNGISVFAKPRFGLSQFPLCLATTDGHGGRAGDDGGQDYGTTGLRTAGLLAIRPHRACRRSTARLSSIFDLPSSFRPPLSAFPLSALLVLPSPSSAVRRLLSPFFPQG